MCAVTCHRLPMKALTVRPSDDLDGLLRFYERGLGLTLLFRFELDSVTHIGYYKHAMGVQRDFTWHELGERVRQRRMARRMTQQALAESAGLTQNAIFRIEAGTTNPQLRTLQQIAGGLGCNVRELLCGMAESSSPLAGWLSRVRAVVESRDQTAIGVLDNGIKAAEALLARSGRNMPSEPIKRVAKGEGRRSLADDLILNQPILRPKSEADHMLRTTNPEWMKVGDRKFRRPKSTHEAK